MFKTNFKENTQYTFTFDLYCDSAAGHGNIAIKYTDGTIKGLYELNSNSWNHDYCKEKYKNERH